MKIAILAHTIPPESGISLGIARYADNLSHALKGAGNDVTMYIRNGVSPSEKWIKTIYSPKLSWIPYPLFACCKSFGMKADVYHADYITTGAAFMWSRKKPVVVAMHDAIPFTYDRRSLSLAQKISVKWFMRCFSSAKKADAIVMASENAKQELIRLTDVDSEKVHAIHYGIDHTAFKPTKRVPHGKIRIGFLGGLDGRKNVGLLVEAFKSLAEKRDDMELHIAGGGSNLEKFRSMNIPNAFFHGIVKPADAPGFYNTLDIFVMPSLQEGFGMMTLEAMSCGLPVVAVNRSSTPEIVGDSGLLVEPDASKLAGAIKRLVENKKLRNIIAKKCLGRSRDFFWGKCASEYMDLYRLLTKC